MFDLITGNVNRPLRERASLSKTIANQPPTGVPGGVEGGIAGGTVGSIVAGLPTQAPLSPPPPREPVRVGGRITAPNVVHQVDPGYPPVALAAGIEGLVIPVAAH